MASRPWLEWVMRKLGSVGGRRAAPARSAGSLQNDLLSVEEDAPKRERQERARAWLEAQQAGLLSPPRDVHDAAAWDEYWRNQLKFDVGGQGLADQMASLGSLPEFLERRRSHTILCAGNGLSLEAVSLAMLGFEVTALDISSVPADVIRKSLQDPQHPLHRVPGFHMLEDGSVAFETSGLIDPGLGPPMHRSDSFPPRGGGSMSLAVGDLTRPEVCPGPFDAVIERRTLQLFPDSKREPALDALIARLATRGTLVSHHHDGGWRPGRPRKHYAEKRLLSQGFAMRPVVQSESELTTPRVAWLIFSSG